MEGDGCWGGLVVWGVYMGMCTHQWTWVHMHVQVHVTPHAYSVCGMWMWTYVQVYVYVWAHQQANPNVIHTFPVTECNPHLSLYPSLHPSHPIKQGREGNGVGRRE